MNKLPMYSVGSESPTSDVIRRFLQDASAATAIEYGLIAAGIAVVIIAAVQTVGTNLSGVFNNVAANIK